MWYKRRAAPLDLSLFGSEEPVSQPAAATAAQRPDFALAAQSQRQPSTLAAASAAAGAQPETALTGSGAVTLAGMEPEVIASFGQTQAEKQQEEFNDFRAAPSGSQTLSTTAVLADSDDEFNDFSSAPISARHQV